MNFVDFDLAKKLKEKGFPQKCFGKYEMQDACYIDDGRFYIGGCIVEVEKAYTAPTISQVLKWLRDEKNIYCLPWFEQGVDMWFYAICKPAFGSEFPEFTSKSDLIHAMRIEVCI